MNWYYTENNQQRGPVTEDEFDQLVQEGKITPATLVWREGMAAWQPYAEVSPSPSGLVPPPFGDATGQTGNISTVSPQRDGPPWEHRATLGLISAIAGTVKGVLFEPAETFTRMRREGGLATPLQYGLLVGGIGAYMGVIYNVITQVVQGYTVTTGATSGRFHFTPETGAFFLMAALFIVPLALTFASFINAGILHLCLILLGGAKQPFETTYRVVCYCFGSAAIFQFIPICGGMIGAIWNIVVTCIGIAKAHEISTGKAVVAVLLPMICCCGLMAAGLALIVGNVIANPYHH